MCIVLLFFVQMLNPQEIRVFKSDEAIRRRVVCLRSSLNYDMRYSGCFSSFSFYPKRNCMLIPEALRIFPVRKLARARALTLFYHEAGMLLCMRLRVYVKVTFLRVCPHT